MEGQDSEVSLRDNEDTTGTTPGYRPGSPGPIILLAAVLLLAAACGQPSVRRQPVPVPSDRASPAPQPARAPSAGPEALAPGPRAEPAGGAGLASPQAQDPAPAPAPPGRVGLVQLDVRETGGRYRDDEPVTRGVPLARGVASDASLLRAWRARDGAALPLQARALSRWPDGSLRWVLVDTRLDLQSSAMERVVVGLAPDLPAGDDPFQLQRSAHGSVSLSDGSRDWELFAPAGFESRVAGFRAQLVDRFERVHHAVLDPQSIELLESGPLRAVVAMRGEHRRADPADDEPQPFHTFEVLLHVQAGLGLAQLEWVLENTPLDDPTGPLAFRSYELLAEVPAGLTTVELGTRRLPADSVVQQLQLDGFGRLTLNGRSESPGPPADLWMGLLGADTSLHVQRVESLQNHPASVSFAPGEPLRVGLLPRVDGVEHFLDDATRKTFRLHLVADAGPAGSAKVARLSNPAHAALLPGEVAASGAWGDAGYLYLPSPGELSQGASAPRDVPTGWADWGEARAKNSHQSGSPRNQLSVFLEAVQSGRAELFRWARSRAWHAMDLRPYHLRGFNADEMPWANLNEGLPHGNEPPRHRLGRDGLQLKYRPYKLNLPDQGHGYNGFDPEHMTLDDVYECYLLTGSWVALSALRSAGEAMLTWKEVRPEGSIHSSRTFGWTLRALVAVHRATGDKRYLDAARALVHRADKERGKGDVKYLRVMKPDNRHIPDKEVDDPWMVAVAMHGLCAYYAETADPLVPPMLVDLTTFCLSAFRGGGFLPDVPIDGSPPPGQVTSPLGVSSWVPGALAAAAFVTGDFGPVDQLGSYFVIMRDHESRKLRFGGGDWHWWQPYLVAVEQQHGRAMSENPKAVLGSGGRR